MKIFLIDEKGMPFLEHQVQGGIQYVIKSQYKLLNDNGHEVYMYVNKDSEFSDNDKIIRSNLKTRRFEDMTSIAYNRQRNEHLYQKIMEVNPDVIINHDQSNNSVTKMLYTKLNHIPSITVIHNCYDVIGGIAGFSYINEMSNLRENNKVIANVSKTSMREWNEYSIRYGKGQIADRFFKEDLFDNWYHTFYSDFDVKIEPSENYFMMVARVSKDKGIQTAARYSKEMNVPFHWYHISPRNENEEEYYEYLKTLNEKENLDIQFHANTPREILLSKMAKARAVFICGPEAGPIVPAEANSFGVPIVTVSPKEHSSLEIARKSGQIHLNKKSKKENLEILSKSKILTYYEKVALSKEFRDAFSKENAYHNLMEIVDKSISLNKVDSDEGLLEFFN